MLEMQVRTACFVLADKVSIGTFSKIFDIDFVQLRKCVNGKPSVVQCTKLPRNESTTFCSHAPENTGALASAKRNS